MKLTKERLKQIIREELMQETGGGSGEGIQAWSSSEEPPPQEPAFTARTFDERAQGLAWVHDIIVDAFEYQKIFPEGQIPQPIMKAIQNAGLRVWDAIQAGEL